MFDEAIALAAAEAPAPVVETPSETIPGLVLHIDGDYLANYHGFVDIPIGVAKENTLNQIRMFKRRVGASQVVIQNTAPGCHKGERYLIATVKPYQAQRSGTRKPENVDRMKAWLREYQGEQFITKTWATREADDGIGAVALYAVGRNPGYVAIATADKDMRMLPGVHICWKHPSIVTRVHPGDYDIIGEDGKQYGLKWFWLQMLMGDTADHIPGLQHYRVDKDDGSFKTLKSCGEKCAENFLRGTTTSDEAGSLVLKEYRRGYPSTVDYATDRFVEQAALLWMRTDKHALLTDFATHDGPSRINGCFDQPVWDAVERLSKRVESARTEINSRGG